MSGEVKIVINFKGDTATIGGSKPNCDPIFGKVEGNRDEIAQGALRILAEAEEKWQETPRYPKCESKLPSQETPPVMTTTARQTTTPAKKDQPVLF
jgi:hypothetical protein